MALVDSRKRWHVVAQIGVIVLALVHACLAYATSLPAIKERRDSLIDGAALFVHCRSTARLHSGNRMSAGKLLRYMEDKGYWAFAPEVYAQPWNEPCPSREGAALVPMLFSAHEYHGDRIAHTAGSIVVQVRDEELHLTVWAEIPSADPEAVIYLGVPVLPAALSNTTLGADVAPGAEPAGPGNMGLEISVSFPPNTDLNAVVNDMCVGFETTSMPLTLFKGNLPICEERVVLSEDS